MGDLLETEQGETERMDTSVVTPQEVAALNAARVALDQIAQRHRATIVHGTAAVAEHVVFTTLNHLNAYLGADLSYDELHTPNAAVPA